MKLKSKLLILLILPITLSCNNENSGKQAKKQNDPGDITSNKSVEKQLTVNPEAILKDFKTWYDYTYYNIHLGQDFIGLDIDSTQVNKNIFLTRLGTGNFIALKTSIKNNTPVYKLYKAAAMNTDIKMTVTQSALHELSNYKMEGKELPDFHFKDLNGNLYDRTTTGKKIVVLKCWFIHCVACVKEFPVLNKLVEEYKQNKDVIFISLAMDSRDELLQFLNQHKFAYAVIPDKRKYMLEELEIAEFPTHILIDKNGKIIKAVNAIEDLIPFLKKETGTL